MTGIACLTAHYYCIDTVIHWNRQLVLLWAVPITIYMYYVELYSLLFILLVSIVTSTGGEGNRRYTGYGVYTLSYGL